MSLAEYIRAMPKAELHVHLEGTVRPETLLELAAGNGVSLPASDVDGLRRWYAFRDFDHFVAVYTVICGCLRRPGDFMRAAYEYGRSMAAQNIRYAEVTFSPGTHVLRPGGLAWDELLDAVNAGRARARA
ncbi:MAG: adenosine deaminase, partial [Chloroflexota bacterium]